MVAVSAHSLTHCKLCHDTYHMMHLYTCADVCVQKSVCTHLQPLLQHTHSRNHTCCLAKCLYEILSSHQMSLMYIVWSLWTMSKLLKVFLLKLLHVASPLLSPPLLTLQLLMPTKMSSTAWLTSHSILNPTLVRHSVWVSTLTAHNSTCVAPV